MTTIERMHEIVFEPKDLTPESDFSKGIPQ
jgi:hypothetical protein